MNKFGQKGSLLQTTKETIKVRKTDVPLLKFPSLTVLQNSKTDKEVKAVEEKN